MCKRNLLIKLIIIFLILSSIICKEESAKKENNEENSKMQDSSEQTRAQNINNINKILNDNTKEEKVFDLLFLIDATGSMDNYIQAAKDETESISKELRQLYPEYHFKYGYIFYRDPIDYHSDIHQIIDLTDQVNDLPEQIGKIIATGGGDLPEDWAGAYKLVNEKINWRNGLRVIIHLADAGAHGKEFTSYDKYPLEGEKLKTELLKCSKNNINIFGFVITEDSRNSFEQCQSYYKSKGGSYEIYDFEIDKKYQYYHHYRKFSDKGKISEDIPKTPEYHSCSRCPKGYFRSTEEIPEYFYESDKAIGGVPTIEESEFALNIGKRGSCYRTANPDEERQKIINTEFKEKVLTSLKTILH